MNKLKIWLQHGVLILCLFGLPTTALQGAESGSDTREPELMQLLSPIALYPDTLLTHMLIASTYPLELVQAQRWRKQRSHWSNERLMAEAENQDWDPSVMALIAFPEVLNKMSTDLDWTARLGEAFIADEGRVMDGIQTLRQAAWDADSLNDLGNLNARRDERQIVIAPTRTEVIYVPYYDSRRVYGHWHWSSYPPIYWDPFPGYVRYHSSPFYWRSAGVSISFNFFFSAFHWHDRVIWVDYRHKHYNHYRPRLAYSQEPSAGAITRTTDVAPIIVIRRCNNATIRRYTTSRTSVMNPRPAASTTARGCIRTETSNKSSCSMS